MADITALLAGDKWDVTGPELEALCERGRQAAEMRLLLLQWEAFARTIASAGLVELPQRLHGQTVGLLDATAV